MYTTYSAAKDAFNSVLNETTGDVQILNFTFEAAYILEQLDAVAYQEEFLNWTDSMGIDLDSLED